MDPFSVIHSKRGHMQLHRVSVLIWSLIGYFFFCVRASFLQSENLYGRFQEFGVDVCFLFTQRSTTQHDFIFAVSSVFLEFFALQAEESDQNLVLTVAVLV